MSCAASLAGNRLRGHVGLAGTPATTLTRHDRAVHQQLAAPHRRAPCAQARLPGRRSWPCIPGTRPSPAPHPAETLRRTAPGPARREDQVPPATPPRTRPPPTDPPRPPCRRPARSPAEPGWPGRRSRPESACRPAPAAPRRSRARRTRRVYPADGGIAPLHRYHPLSLASWYPSCDLWPARGLGRYSSVCPVGGWVGNALGEGVTRPLQQAISHPIRTRAPYGGRWSAVEIQDGSVWPYQAHQVSVWRAGSCAAGADGQDGSAGAEPDR